MNKIRNIMSWYKITQQLQAIAHTNAKDGKIYAFLDMDGVVNVFFPEGTPEYAYRLEHQNDEMCMADRAGVKRLSKLFMQNDIYVVISSTWRLDGIDFCRTYLEKAGMDKRVHIVDGTPYMPQSSREMEIVTYLLEHQNFKQFIILDDMAMPHLKKHLLHCDCTKGYTEELHQRAERLLNDHA